MLRVLGVFVAAASGGGAANLLALQRVTERGLVRTCTNTTG
jgi:hypothetical protein